jgi:hypothetical protein
MCIVMYVLGTSLFGKKAEGGLRNWPTLGYLFREMMPNV